MRVVFLLESFFHYTSELASALVRSGMDVTIIASDSCGDFMGTGSGDIQADYREMLDPRIKLEWFHIPEDTNVGTLLGNAAAIGKMIRLVRKHKPDVLHTMDAADYRLLSAVSVCRLTCPVVLTIHDAELHPGDSGNKQEFLRPWLRRVANAVIVHGHDIERRLLADGAMRKNRLHRIPRGPYLIYKKWAKDTAADGKRVLFFGRIREYKGLEYLVKAAPIVCRQVPDAKFVVAGSGPDLPRCRELIENPESFAMLDRKVSEPEVTKLFEEASVVVLPYTEASQSGVLFIAYAFGKPVIVTDVGSLPEVVDDGETGFIVPPRDVDALAEAIVRVLGDEKRLSTMSARALEKVTTGELSWDSIAAKTTGLYKALISGRRDRRTQDGKTEMQ